MSVRLAAVALSGMLAAGYFNDVQPRQSGLNEIIQTVRADAARRSGLEESALRVALAEAVTWGDGSLGCPAPGESYTQALVPGYRVRIEGGGKTYDYHASRRGAWILCPPGRAIEVPGPARS